MAYYVTHCTKSKKPELLDGILFEKAIADYICEMGNSLFHDILSNYIACSRDVSQF